MRGGRGDSLKVSKVLRSNLGGLRCRGVADGGVGLQKEHPESKKVADVARAAGERWRAMSNEDKAAYERLSSESKVGLWVKAATNDLELSWL